MTLAERWRRLRWTGPDLEEKLATYLNEVPVATALLGPVLPRPGEGRVLEVGGGVGRFEEDLRFAKRQGGLGRGVRILRVLRLAWLVRRVLRVWWHRCGSQSRGEHPAPERDEHDGDDRRQCDELSELMQDAEAFNEHSEQ